MTHDAEEWFKEKLILKKYVFLCNATDFKQSVEGTFKMQGKSLKTVLYEVHFIVNLYSLPLSLVPQADSSFLKVCHLSPSQAEELPKIPPLLLLTPLSWGYLNSQFSINKMVNSLHCYPYSSRLALRIHSINSLGLNLSPEYLLNFLSQTLWSSHS